MAGAARLRALAKHPWPGCADVVLMPETTVTLGRSARTKVQDVRCSRQAMDIVLNNDGTVTVTQLSKNPCSVDGEETKQLVPRTARNNSVVCLLPNKYCFRVITNDSVVLPARQRLVSHDSTTEPQPPAAPAKARETAAAHAPSTSAGQGSTSPSSSSSSGTAGSAKRQQAPHPGRERSVAAMLMSDGAPAAKKPKEGAEGKQTPAATSSHKVPGVVRRSERESKHDAGQQHSSVFASLPTKVYKGPVVVPLPKGWHCLRDSVLCHDYGNVQPSSKVAAFDFDGCLASTRVGGFDPKAWSMRFKSVPSVVRRYADKGFKIAIFTNESIERFKSESAIRKALFKKIGRLTGFLEAVNVPTQVFCMLRKDEYRKPSTAIWEALETRFNGGVRIQLSDSFYVGDAAGRPHDHSDDDRRFAANVGVRFMTEKQCFLSRK